MEQWEIKNRLKERIRDICTSMLPGGVFDTHYYRCGSVRGGKGDSCVVHLDGARRGEFFENSPKGDETFSSGSALDLLMAAQGISDVKEGFAAAARFLGVSTSRPNERVFKPSRTYSQPASEKKEYEPIKPMIETSPVSEGSQAWEYLVGERMLDPEILRKYRVAEGVFSFAVQTPDGSRQYKRMPGYAFRYYSPDGQTLCGTKYFALERDENGKKRVLADRGMSSENYHLFGMQRVPENADEIVICEGEIDALTLASLGYNAVSVPFGAKADASDGRANSGNAWIENDWEWLSKFTRIKICMDNDEAGRAAAATLMNRLNLDRTELVEIPDSDFGKDANDLFRGDVNLLKSAVENSRPLDPATLGRVMDYRAKIKSLFFPADERAEGRRLPWTLPEGDGGMNIRDGEVTVVSGYSKHGKTTLLDWICVNLAARYGERIMLASLEIPSEQTAQVLWRQCMGMRKPLDIYGHPDEALLDEGLEWLDKHFFFYNHVGRAKFAELLEVMKYAARRYAVKIFVLDSLMKLGVRKDDLNGHNELLDTLDVFSKQYRCHVFLVAHAKKPQDKDREWRHIPEKYEVEGSGDITNIACNTWVVQRNYQKEDAINNLEYSLSKTRDEKEVAQLEEKLDTERRKADAIWVVRAQRWGDGSTPKKFLYFDKNSWSYSEDYNFTPQKIAKPS